MPPISWMIHVGKDAPKIGFTCNKEQMSSGYVMNIFLYTAQY